MYWLRMYEYIEIELDHYSAEYAVRPIFGLRCPGFLNAVNRYYGYRVWK